MARFCRNTNKTPGKTCSVAQTSTVRGTLAYLPEEYLKDGQLGVEIDVYSFGVVRTSEMYTQLVFNTDIQGVMVICSVKIILLINFLR